jgi:carbonic anhydrase
VDPVLLFDQGLGDLFVMRLAGNVVDDMALGTIEYGVEHLHVPLVMVLGHQKCGAVEATVEAVEKGSEVPGHIGSLVDAIKPAVEQVRGQPGDVVDNSIRANVALVVEQIKSAQPILAEMVERGELLVVGGYYDLTGGVVEVIQAKAG